MIKNKLNVLKKSIIKVFKIILIIKMIFKINLKLKNNKCKFIIIIIIFLKKVNIKFKKSKARLYKFKKINQLKIMSLM